MRALNVFRRRGARLSVLGLRSYPPARRWPGRMLAACAAAAFITAIGRAEAPVGQYMTLNAGGVAAVYDVRSTLLWQQTATATMYTWLGAQSYCGELGEGWRLPSLEELESIIDEQTSATEQIDAVFAGTSGNYYWTLSPYVATPGYVWVVGFATGGDAHESDPTSANAVRCVNDGGSG